MFPPETGYWPGQRSACQLCRSGAALDPLSHRCRCALDRRRCRRPLHGPRRAKSRGQARRLLLSGADAPKWAVASS
jgi:hypothetical protein